MADYKYLIVGQGIAGTLIAMECLKRKLPFLVIDDPELSVASKVAAGIINPLTGRKFVKSWMFEELEKVFIDCYLQFKELLGEEYLVKREILRALPKTVDQNNWDLRTKQDDACQYMTSDIELEEYREVVKGQLSYGMVKGFQLKMGQLIEDFRSFLKAKSLIKFERFSHDELITAEEIVYKEWSSEAIIFCEGHKITENPFFKNLPFSPAKGELLLVKIPDLKTKRLLKDTIFIVPVRNDLYWVGASYGWENFNDEPSEVKKKWLIESLDKVLKVTYEIVDHKAGVRPATKYRRPLMGTHPDYNHVHLFNGLGTKGASLGPYWARHFMEHLENGRPLSKEVDIKRVF